MICINVELTELNAIYLTVLKKTRPIRRELMCGITQTIVS